MVCGNNRLPQQDINKIYPFNLSQVKVFKPDYLLDWQSRAYDKDLNETFSVARSFIEGRILSEAASYLADDTYKDLNVETLYTHETFKQIILPVWICQYLFKGKTNQFIINGQSGIISGNKPLSISKIVIAVVITIIIIALLYMMSQ